MRTVISPVRKCGYRQEGGIYLIGGEGAGGGILDRFVRINPPIPYPVKLHRSPRVVNGFEVLNRSPMEQWWIGTSLETEQRKAGDAWAEEIFGMPIRERIGFGECEKVADADEALKLLGGKVKNHKGIIKTFGVLSVNQVHSFPLTAAPYERMHQSIREYRDTGKLEHLLTLQASVWSLASRIPPSKVTEYTRELASILVYLGLPKDAAALIRKYREE